MKADRDKSNMVSTICNILNAVHVLFVKLYHAYYKMYVFYHDRFLWYSSCSIKFLQFCLFFILYSSSTRDKEQNDIDMQCEYGSALILLSYLHILLQDKKSYDCRPKESIIWTKWMCMFLQEQHVLITLCTQVRYISFAVCLIDRRSNIQFPVAPV